MKIKKVHLAGVIGLLLIVGLVLSPVVNVAAIGTFTDENGRIVHPVVNPDSKPFGENQPPKILHYNHIADMLKYNQYPMWLIMKHNR